MSGHSKWKNIMHKKEKTDSQRAKVFTKIGREIALAVKEGGPDPVANGKLKDVILKAKQNNVPNDNIDRIIKKAGGGDGDSIEEIVYEGYGACGIAVIVETLTDNRNRTAGDLRHYFDKFGGNLGQSGSVAWMFQRRGVLVIERGNLDPDALMMDALDCGASDIGEEADVFMVITSPEDLSAVRDAMEKRGYESLSAEIEYEPSTWVTVEGEDNLKSLGRLMETLEDNDDVQNVWHNWENDGSDEEEE